MELTVDEIEKYLEEIFTKKRIIDLDDRVVYFVHPSNELLLKARYVRDLEYKSAIKDGFLSAEEIRDVLKERKFITEDDKKKLAKLKSQLEAQKILLAKTTKVKANRDRIKSVIDNLESEINKIEHKESSKLGMSADVKASEMKMMYLCWGCTYDFMTNELYWKSFDEFLVENDIVFRQTVLNSFIEFYSGIPTNIIRAIARHNLWRIRYLTSIKTSESLFGIPTSEYSSDMINLAYWSHYYQNIYEMMPEDQPPESIIDDDEALDAYMEDYYKEKQKEILANRDKKKFSNKNLAAFDKEEVIVTRSNELYEDIEYDVPKEAQLIKDRNLIRKRTRHG